MSFNFNLNNTPVANTTNYLKPYDIYQNVGIESVEFKNGTSEKGNNWKCLRITFKSPDGIYTESLFIPNAENPKDITRAEFDMPNGGKRPAPSGAENFMAMVAAIGSNFNPKGYEKLQELSSKFKSFDDVAQGLKSILEKGTVTTSMKLIGKTTPDGKIYARLPKPLAMTQDNGEWRAFAVAMFGDNLSFTNYEQEKRNAYLNAKPTAVGNSAVDTDPINNFDSPSGGSEDIDFNSLVNGL